MQYQTLIYNIKTLICNIKTLFHIFLLSKLKRNKQMNLHQKYLSLKNLKTKKEQAMNLC